MRATAETEEAGEDVQFTRLLCDLGWLGETMSDLTNAVTDVAPVAGQIVLAVAPYLQVAGMKAIEKSVDVAYEHRGKIWSLVKSLFKEDDLTLLNLEQTPGDQKLQGKLEAKLEAKLDADPNLLSKFAELLKSVPTNQETHNTLTQTGNNNNGIVGSPGGSITVDK